MAYFDTTWYCNAGDQSTTGHYAVAKWAATTAIAAGALRRQLTAPAVGNERVFVAIVGGTTGSVEPVWVLTRGAKSPVDGTVTWMECTGASAVNGDKINTPNWTAVKAAGTPSLGVIIQRNNGASYQICTTAGTLGAAEPSFSDTAGVTTTETSATTVWTSLGVVGNFTGGQAPHARLANACVSTWFAAGNTIYVGDNHAESQATAISISPASIVTAMGKILCHNHSGSYPPTNLTTGATVTTTAAANISMTFAGMYTYGVTFQAGSGASSTANIIISSSANQNIFDNCSLQILSTFANLSINLGSGGSTSIILNNTTMKFSNVAQYVTPAGGGVVTWQNTAPALASGSLIPTNFFNLNSSGATFILLVEAVDLSAITGTVLQYANVMTGSFVFKDCKLNASASFATPITPTSIVQLVRSDSSGTAYKSARYQYEGTETTETSITRVGGATDPAGQAQSRKLVTTANSQWLRPFKAEPYAIWNPTAGANVTVTVCGTIQGSVLPNNDDVWMECEYLGSSASPLGTIVNTTKANVLAANAAVASDSSTWSNTAFAIFDPTTANQTTVSSDGLTATHASANTNTGVLGSSFATSGKYYFEITRGTTFLSAGADIFGAITSSGSLATVTSNTQCLTVNSGGTTVSNGGIIGAASVGVVAVGDVVGYALDLNARLGWVRKNAGNWNNSGTANPATGVGGVNLYPTGGYAPGAVYFGTSSAAGGVYVLNCGQSAYANAAPSGFGNFPAVWSSFKLTATLSAPQPGMAGYLHARVRAAKPSTIFYIDPQITLS